MSIDRQWTQSLAGTKISKDKKSPWGISASLGIGVGSSNEASSNKPATAPAAPHHGQHAGTSMPHRFGKCAETWAVGGSSTAMWAVDVLPPFGSWRGRRRHPFSDGLRRNASKTA